MIEHGITAGGKPLRDHLEAVDHYNAALWSRELAAKSASIDENAVREIHRRVVLRSQPGTGGIYRTLPRRIAGSAEVFPNAAKALFLLVRAVPGLMKEFGDWLAAASFETRSTFEAHFRLVRNPSFFVWERTDGAAVDEPAPAAGAPAAGRISPVAVRPGGRKSYLDALEHASTKHASTKHACTKHACTKHASTKEDLEPFQIFLHQRLDDTLAEHLKVLEGA